MIESTVIETLKSLSASEITSFGKFIRSPFFNESRPQVKLYEVLRKYYPGFKGRNLTKEKVYRKLFPGKRYNDEAMRKILSDMQRLLEDFFSHSYINESSFDKNIYLLEKLDGKRLEKQFTRKLRTLEAEYKMTAGNISESYFERNFTVANTKWNHIIGAGSAGQYNAQSLVLETHPERFSYFIAKALINILKMSQDFISIARFYNVDYSSTLAGKFLENFRMEEYINEFKTKLPLYYPIIQIYYCNYLLLSESCDDSVYFLLKKLVLENTEMFTLHERKIQMLFLENGCLAKIREGKKEFMNELHAIYEIMLSDRLYVYKDSHNMTTSRFIKIVQNAVDIKQYEWAKSFIEKYSDELAPDALQSVKNFSYAQLHYGKGEYGRAIEYSSQVKSLSFTQNFQNKLLRLKCCYELDYMDEILYQLDSYRHTLQNDSLSPEAAKEKFHAFMYFLGKMVKMRLSGETTAAGQLQIELSEKNEPYEKQWLEDKLKQFRQPL